MVTLEPVAAGNRRAIQGLTVRDDQRDFLDCASVAHVLREYRDRPAFRPHAIRSRGSIVGLVIYGVLPDDSSRAWLPLLLIDAMHRRRGYGRAAMAAVFDELRRRAPPPRALGLSYRPGNRGAAALYASLGFRPRGTDAKGDVVAWSELDEG